MSEEDLKSKLKYCVVKNQKNELKKLLFETVALRRELLKKEREKIDGNNNDDGDGDDDGFMDFWKFYFVDTDLV